MFRDLTTASAKSLAAMAMTQKGLLKFVFIILTTIFINHIIVIIKEIEQPMHEGSRVLRDTCLYHYR